MVQSGRMVKMMNQRELSDSIGVAERTIAQWRYLGRGPKYHKLGGHVRYDPAEVQAWIEENTVDVA